MTQRQKLPEWLMNIFNFGRNKIENAQERLAAKFKERLVVVKDKLDRALTPLYGKFEEELKKVIDRLSSSVSKHAAISFAVKGQEAMDETKEWIGTAEDKDGNVELDEKAFKLNEELDRAVAETKAAEKVEAESAKRAEAEKAEKAEKAET